MQINQFNANEKILQYTDKLNLYFNKHKTLISSEVDLTNKCNSKCPACTGRRFVDKELDICQVSNFANQFVECGGKSVVISGGGEPTVSPIFSEALNIFHDSGLSIGINTNGININYNQMESILKNCNYVRFSLDAGNPAMYNQTHGLTTEYNTVLNNIKELVKLRSELGSRTSISTGYLTGASTNNFGEMQDFVTASLACGVDFAQFRPFTNEFVDITEDINKLKSHYDSDSFKVVGANHKYSRYHDEEYRPYNKCHGMFFNTVLTATYELYACIHHRYDQQYFLGNLKEHSIKNIMNSPRILEVFNSINFNDCPYFCRNDDINRRLHILEQPVTHSEFL